MLKTLLPHKKHLSQLTCVVFLPFSVATDPSFIGIEFIC